MSLVWYAKRLASMSFLEVLHRVDEQIKRSASRQRSHGWQAFDQGGTLRTIPHLKSSFREGVSPALAERIRTSADAIIEGHFSAHGVIWPKRPSEDLFPEAVWRFDPITGRVWPGADLYCFDVPYRHRRDLGDIKYVWDFNRLQFLQPLAAAVALWGDNRAAETISAAIASWVRYNPPFRGLAWNSGIELSLRSVSLVFVAALCGEHLDPTIRDQIAMILRAHLYWLSRFPSRFSSANNHLVAEALGEFVIAAVLSDAEAPAIADRALRTLQREATLQIHPDGVGAEQSPNYGAFTAEMLLVAGLVAQAFGRTLGPAIDARLEAFVSFVGWMSDGHDRVPNIGDDDEGRVLTLCAGHEHSYPSAIAKAIAGHLSVARHEETNGAAPELRDAFFSKENGVASVPEGVKTFEVGGYSIVRERRAGRKVRLTVDHGPLGYLAIAAHGHADANAFTLSLDDRDVLVDPGTFLYHSGGNWRDWFRGTPAHNTLTVDGTDQSTIAGPFNWSHKANAWLEAVETGEPWSITVAHDGYLKRFGAHHRRVLRATAKGMAVVDTLPNAKRRHGVEATFQFAPGLDVQCEDGRVAVLQGGHVLMKVGFSEPGDLATIKGGDCTQGGWVSESFGHKAEACRLVWRGLMPAEGLRTELDWSMRSMGSPISSREYASPGTSG